MWHGRVGGCESGSCALYALEKVSQGREVINCNQTLSADGPMNEDSPWVTL